MQSADEFLSRCVLLFVTLPATTQARHWAVAWAGLDGGTLLVVDAWFDVCTSAVGFDHTLAVAEAICVELPHSFPPTGPAR
jgi:hypothetical protein